jgi:hypothetical protein
MTTSRSLAWSLGWPAGSLPSDYVLGGVRAVLVSSVIDDARIVVRDGVIAEIGPVPAGSAADLDGRGLLCVPGLIDVHSDALERERAPRPGVHLPWDFAVTSLEGKLHAAGITTAFHGAGFQDKMSGAMTRSARTALEVCEAITGRTSDHDYGSLWFPGNFRSYRGCRVTSRPDAVQANFPVNPVTGHERLHPLLSQTWRKRLPARTRRMRIRAYKSKSECAFGLMQSPALTAPGTVRLGDNGTHPPHAVNNPPCSGCETGVDIEPQRVNPTASVTQFIA